MINYVIIYYDDISRNIMDRQKHIRLLDDLLRDRKTEEFISSLHSYISKYFKIDYVSKKSGVSVRTLNALKLGIIKIDITTLNKILESVGLALSYRSTFDYEEGGSNENK